MLAPPQGLTAAEFEAIEAAIKETERGRRFLAEFVRRRQAEESARILAAIDRLEARVAEADAAEARARLDADRAAMLSSELSYLLRDLRPAVDARALPSSPGASTRAAPRNFGGGSGLEARLAGLVKLEALEVEQELNLNRLG